MVMPLLELSAQARGTLIGTVTDTGQVPIAGARITLTGTDGVALTEPNGRLRLARAVAGAQTLEVRRLGYKRVFLAVQVDGGTTREVRVTMLADPTALDPVEVTAQRAMSPQMRGFEERRARGAGFFFTREQIARMQPRVVTDVLRRVPGVQIQPVQGPYETSYVVRMSRATGGLGNRACPVLFFINGTPFPVTGEDAINAHISPDDIEAIEVYSGTSRIPPQLTSNMHNSRCGVIAIWTRDGKDAKPSP
jgi:hypothetical protein